jgi:hypothetical protein
MEVGKETNFIEYYSQINIDDDEIIYDFILYLFYLQVIVI